jgi:hypothetical protein
VAKSPFVAEKNAGRSAPRTLPLREQNSRPVVSKFFPLDKNYLLKQAQLRTEQRLLQHLFGRVQQHYTWRYNPLGLNDPTSERIAAHTSGGFDLLHPFYLRLAGVYRYKFGCNQLEFLWDGSDHEHAYEKAWSRFFAETTEGFCRNELFLRAVLDLTVFRKEPAAANLAGNRMSHFLAKTFALRIGKTGIREMKVA